VWSHDLTIDLLDVLPSREVRTVQEYPIGYRELTTTW
jgi:hypothetical protein